MRHKTLPLAAALAALILLSAAASHAASHTDKAKAAATDAKKSGAQAMEKAADMKKEMSTDAASMTAEMMKMGAPGPQHEGLKGMVGKWKAVQKSWFAPGEPTVSEGVSENTLILGGRFVQQNFTGNFMGMPFEGMGITGYDNLEKVYTSYWIDNMGTSSMSASGTMNEAGNEIVMKSSMPGMDGKPQMTRTVTKIVDPTHHTFSMYVVQPDGKEQLMMEINYTKM